MCTGDAAVPSGGEVSGVGHGAAPGTGLAAERLDELLETLEIALDAQADRADRVADVLHEALRVVVDLQHDARPGVAQTMERDDAGVLGAGDAVPGDAHVGHLLIDLRFPRLVDAADLGAPQEPRVAQL